MRSPFPLLVAALLGGLAVATEAQIIVSDFQVITPAGQSNQAIDISPNGEYVCGGGGTNGFIWSQTGGLETGFGFSVNAWGVTDDGDTMVGEFLNGSGQLEAGVWTASGGTQLLGNAGGATGCGSDLSHLFDVASDGSTAVGMSWQGCQVSPMRWRPGTGLTLMAKQNATESARASVVSADGLVAGGWDQGTPTGGAFNRRACLWPDDATQLFPATTATNPQGLGEVTALTSDGTWCAGSTQGRAFRWSSATGLQLLPNVSGLGGDYFANGISDAGDVIVGVRLQFPTAEAIIWTVQNGAQRLYDVLVANGVTGITPGDIANCTGISADGTRICGWGGGKAWVVTLGDTWTDLGGGTAGIQGVPLLEGSGPLTAGSTLSLDLTSGAPSSLILLWFSTTSMPVDVLGGTVHALPYDFEVLLATDGAGAFSGSATVPAGTPSGSEVYFQFICQDVTTLYGLTLSNAVRGTFP